MYALPHSLRQYFIQHINFLSAHAIDADKRRYASSTEAYQHYFDSEMWEPYIDIGVSHTRKDLARKVPSWMMILEGDTTLLCRSRDSISLGRLVDELPHYFSGSEWETGDTLFIDTMARHGVLPIAIIRRFHALKTAFKKGNTRAILDHASNLGHYVADAHVPLHTTVNYNGQLTGQNGIHAFWETSIPELLTEDSFDLVVGRADYVRDVKTYVWQIIRSSHLYVADVLNKEKELRAKWPDGKETCPIDRNGKTFFWPCPELTSAYHEAMGGMVESQMRKAIYATACLWWTAYVEVGQPVLGNLNHMSKESSGTNAQESTDCGPR
ncbi:MAG: hypothetical protein R3275_08485 [Saprospiraceae bacterium]|nr:hypothetical protein [Saprospiraceae bacterium]